MSEPSMSESHPMVSTMKRTVRLATLSLNKGKYDELRAIIGHYTDAKRVFVAHLRQTSLWGLLDLNQA